DTARIMTVAKRDRRRVKQIAAFHLAYPGAPMIYYGSETGLEGEDAEDGRRCMPWDDLDQEMLTYYKHIISIHRRSRALRLGSYETILLDDGRRLYGFARRCDDEVVLALFNGSDEAIEVDLQQDDSRQWEEVIHGRDVFQAQNGVLKVQL